MLRTEERVSSCRLRCQQHSAFLKDTRLRTGLERCWHLSISGGTRRDKALAWSPVQLASARRWLDQS